MSSSPSSNICKIFKEETGTTLNRYITAKRITIAKELLSGGSSVTDACMSCGFRDYSNFLKAFTKAVGVSPKKYAALAGMFGRVHAERRNGAPSRAMLADWAFVRRPHAFRAARQAAPAIPPACLPRGAPSRAGAWREIVLRFCANYISYYWICANSYWPLLDLQEELLANLRISIFCKKLSLQFSNFFLQISYFPGFRYFARIFLFNSQISSCKFRISASAKKPFLQILKFFSYARNCLSARHAQSRPSNTARAAH